MLLEFSLLVRIMSILEPKNLISTERKRPCCLAFAWSTILHDNFSASEIYTTPIPPKQRRVGRVDRANYVRVTQHENRMFELLYAFRKQLIVLVIYKGGFDYLFKSKQFFRRNIENCFEG